MFLSYLLRYFLSLPSVLAFSRVSTQADDHEADIVHVTCVGKHLLLLIETQTTSRRGRQQTPCPDIHLTHMGNRDICQAVREATEDSTGAFHYMPHVCRSQRGGNVAG